MGHETKNETKKETKTNSELIRHLYEKIWDTQVKMQSHIDADKVLIEREIEPNDEDFRKTRIAVNAILDETIKKKPKSTRILRTSQDLKIISANDDERLKVKTLIEYLTSRSVARNFDDCLQGMDKNQLNAVFSDKSSVQFVFSPNNHNYSDYYEKEHQNSIKSDSLNLINGFVTDTKISRCTTISSNRRYLTTNLDYYNRSTEGHIESFLDYTFARSFTYFISDNFSQNNLSVFFNNLMSNDTRKTFAADGLPLDDYNDAVENLTDECVNALNSKWVLQIVNYNLKNLNDLNERIDTYEQEVSISASKYFETFPDISAFIDAHSEEVKKEEERLNSLVRTTQKVTITLDVDIELDSDGSEEDIKRIISKAIGEYDVQQSFSKSHYIDALRFGKNQSDYFVPGKKSILGFEVTSPTPLKRVA